MSFKIENFLNCLLESPNYKTCDMEWAKCRQESDGKLVMEVPGKRGDEDRSGGGWIVQGAFF